MNNKKFLPPFSNKKNLLLQNLKTEQDQNFYNLFNQNKTLKNKTPKNKGN